MALLEVEDLQAHFHTRNGVLKAVDGVTFSVDEGETLALAGESGSGKSVTGLSIMQLNPQPPCVYAGGEVRLSGRNLLGMPDKELRRIRGNQIAMIFQDPMTSLNPVIKVGEQIAETLRIHQGMTKSEARRRTVQVLKDVGIANPERRAEQFPHEFSGGMRQRAMIAIGLACNPKVLIADEPTTALDVTIQAQILELMRDLQHKHGTAIIMVTHDLGVVANMADSVAVMYAGRIVEQAPTRDIFYDPQMPYTVSLLHSIPRLDTAGTGRLVDIPGQPPSPLNLPPGCSFAARCPFVHDACHEIRPSLEIKEPGHASACLLSVDEVRERRVLLGAERSPS